MIRKIIHIDMDAFYASIEQRDNPELRGKPVAVGYAESRGVVAAASYEARKYGVHSAMPSVTARRKCPHLIFVDSHFDVYREVSHQIMDIFLEYTELVEPLSLDEAFLDITDHPTIPSATIIAKEIKKKIKEVTGLTASAGVSFNKFLAKIASDYNKPDGLFVILPSEAEAFVEKLEIERFYGVGKVTADKMHRLGIHTGNDLKKLSEDELKRHFGKVGSIYYNNARAIDERRVSPNRIRKSIGAENTFETDLDKSTSLTIELYHIARRVWERIEAKQLYGYTLTLKVKYADFEINTRSRTLSQRFDNFNFLWNTAKDILSHVDTTEKKIRLMGLSVSNFENNMEESQNNGPIQLEIEFED